MDIINIVMEAFGDILEIMKTLPAEILAPAMLVFVIVAVLKGLKLVGEDGYAATANLAISIFVNGGLTALTDEQQALIVSATAGGAAVIYKFYDRVLVGIVWPWILATYARLRK